MVESRAVWALAIVAAFAGLACGSSVTLDTTGGNTGGATSTGGAGGAGAGAQGGAVMGGSSMGGAQGGASAGGAIMGGSSTGGGGAGGTGGSAEVCPGLGDACTDCLSTGCADVYCGCYNEPHCGGYLECLGTCMAGDTACQQNCAKVHEAGISAAFLTADCAATTCDADCNFGKALQPCQKCLYTECAGEMNTCIADPECLALIQCLQMCMAGDMACAQACVAAHQSALPEAQAIGACRNSQCSNDCP